MENNQEWVTGKLVPLHRARLKVAADDAERKAQKDAFEAEHAGQWDLMKIRQRTLADMEASVRAEALRLYNTTPNASKTFLLGVTIRDTKVYYYLPKDVVRWVLEHQEYKAVLRVDDVEYKKLLNAGVIPDIPGEVYKEPRATVAEDLGPVLEAIEAETITGEPAQSVTTSSPGCPVVVSMPRQEGIPTFHGPTFDAMAPAEREAIPRTEAV